MTLFHIWVLSVIVWLIRQSQGFILRSVDCIIIIYLTYVHNIHRRLLKCDLVQHLTITEDVAFYYTMFIYTTAIRFSFIVL